jgi:hypothetical protein
MKMKDEVLTLCFYLCVSFTLFVTNPLTSGKAHQACGARAHGDHAHAHPESHPLRHGRGDQGCQEVSQIHPQIRGVTVTP